MKRAIPMLLVLAAAGPACSSSGSTSGPALPIGEPSQSAPNDTQEALFNPDGPVGNSQQPPVNPDSPPFATAPATHGFDTCPLLCGHIDAQCAERCAQTCAIYNQISGSCSEELARLFMCVGNNGGLSCNDNGRLRLQQGLCTAEVEAALPCLEVRVTPQPTSTATVANPGPTGIPNPLPPPTFDGGR